MYTSDDDLRTVNIIQKEKELAAEREAMARRTAHDTPTATTPLGHYYNGMTKYANMQPVTDCTNQHERSGWWAALDADVDFLVDDGRTYLEREAGQQYHNFCGPNHA